MLIAAVVIYFLPTIVALSRGCLSALTIFFLNLFLGWTLIGWIAALIWSCTGATAANFHRLQANAASPVAPAPRSSSAPLWVVLIIILVAIVLLDKRRDFRDVRSFDFTFPSPGDFRL
jgi:hypothetical protein